MQRKSENKKLIFPIIIAAVISVVAFLGVACLFFADLFLDGGDAVEIIIPRYEGMHEASIEESDGILLEKSYVFSSKVDKGIVISQSKKGAVKLARGEKYPVRLTVSLGVETHRLPKLAGLDIYEASGIVRQMGCIPKTVFSESERTPDSVLFTLPEADTEIKAGETVILYVAARSSIGTLTVPDFYGCGMDDLYSRVEESGLGVGKIEFIYSEDFLPNCVIYQSVGKGCIVKVGEKIDFYVSRPPIK